NLDSVEEVRGQGLLLGIRFENRTAKSIQQALLANKILAGTSSDAGILRLMPPLTITREEAGIFIKAVKNL
ncbi:MAG: hypothetical protein NWE76_02840, partial [Candidatus Bathyarchaeota archaeon]|nr:hypothetical protein [Candidatus Bathyarchaeota archaeon]